MQTKTFQVEGADTTLTVHLATTFWQRFRGLMLRRPLPPATALLIAPCNSIHMCFMRFAIDAVYLDKQGKILKITRHLRPLARALRLLARSQRPRDDSRTGRRPRTSSRAKLHNPRNKIKVRPETIVPDFFAVRYHYVHVRT